MSYNNQIQRAEARQKEAANLILKLAEDYKAGNFSAIKLTVKGDKAVRARHALKRDRFEVRMQEDAHKRAQAGVDPVHALNRFTLLNMEGSAVDVASFLAARLAPTTDNFTVSCGMFGMVAFLLSLADSGDQTVINRTNQAGVKVLTAFESYASAVDEMSRKRAFEDLYRSFVTDIYDRCAATVQQLVRERRLLNSDSSAAYNSSDQTRDSVDRAILGYIVQLKDALRILANQNVTVVSYSSWIKHNPTPKGEVKSVTYSIVDIHRLGLETKAIVDDVLGLPSNLRFETERGVTYPMLGLNPSDAPQLVYAFGTNFKLVKVDTESGHRTGDGTRKVKTLTPAMAVEKLANQFARYYTPSGGADNKVTNIRELLERRKYIDITDAVPSQALKLNIATHTSSVVFLFPDRPQPRIPERADDLKNDKAALLDIIMYSLGYASGNSNKVSPEHVRSVITELYNVFGMTVPTGISWNQVPSKGNSRGSNVFDSQGRGHTSAAPQQQSSMFGGSPAGFEL